MSKFPFVVLLVLNYNRKDLLARCLETLAITNYPNYKIMVVDNGSQDGSDLLVKNDFPYCELIHLEKNVGYSKGNDIGIKYALEKYPFDYIVLLNNDIEIIQENWLMQLIRTAKIDDRIGIVGCKLIYPDRTIQHAGVVSKWPLVNRGSHEPEDKYGVIEEVIAVVGACFLISRSCIDKIGLLDEIYTPAYSEETDYCFRAKKFGYKIYYDGQTKLIHKEGSTIGKDAVISDSIFFVKIRNRIILYLRYLPLYLPLVILGFFKSVFVERKDERRSLFNLNNITLFPRGLLPSIKYFLLTTSAILMGIKYFLFGPNK